MDNKKVILQTAGGTIAAIMVAMLFIFNITALLMPARMGMVYDAAGAERMSIALGRVSYERSDDTYDLSVLVERTIKYGDYYGTAQYAPMLMEKSDYKQLCEYKDSQLDLAEFDGMDSDYNSYIEGNYIASLYFSGEYGNCIARIGQVLKGGYSRTSPARFFASLLSREGVFYQDFADALEDAYYSLSDNPQEDIEQKKHLSIDLYALYSNSENTQKTKHWEQLALSYIKNK